MRVARAVHERGGEGDTITMKNTLETISTDDLTTITGGMGLGRAMHLSHHPRILANHPVIASRVAHRLEVRAANIQRRFGA
jgi:hypothetical protein